MRRHTSPAVGISAITPSPTPLPAPRQQRAGSDGRYDAHSLAGTEHDQHNGDDGDNDSIGSAVIPTHLSHHGAAAHAGLKGDAAAHSMSAVGDVRGPVAALLAKHACIVAALASRLPGDADISPAALRRSMDVFAKAAWRRIRELSDVAPDHAMAVLTQFFVFEGLGRREEQESTALRERRSQVDALQSKVSSLEAALKEKMGEVQLLREAVLEVQTNANRQVMDARSLQRACEREIARQAAELAKLSQANEHLKLQLEAFESRNARQYLDTSDATVGAGAAVRALRRVASPTVGPASPPPPPPPTADLPRRSLAANGGGGAPPDVTPLDVVVDSALMGGGMHLTPLAGRRGEVSPAQRSGRGGGPLDPGSSASPPPGSGSLAPSSPIGFGTAESFGTVNSFTRHLKGVPNEAEIEAVYLQMGGMKDRSTKVPANSVLRHLERTYDDLGDPHRFVRVLGGRTHLSFEEFAVVLLQVAKL